MSDASRRIATLSPEKRALLFERLKQQRTGVRAPEALPPLVPQPLERFEPFPLSPVQQVYWAGRSGLFELSECGTNTFMEYEVILPGDTTLDRFSRALQRLLERISRRAGALDPSLRRARAYCRRFDSALQRVVERHDMLRTIVLSDGRQQVLPEAPPYQIALLDVRERTAEAIQVELAAARARLSVERGAIDRWPLFDFRAYLLGERRLWLLARIDTLLIDGTSRSILLRDLAQFLQFPQADPPPLECSYRDYTLAWQAARGSAAYRHARDYWLSRIPTLPYAPDLPLAPAVDARPPTRFVNSAVELLDAAAWARIKAHAGGAGLTPALVVIAAFADMLATWSRSASFTFGLIGSYRPPLHPQIDAIIGNFNTIYLLTVDGEPRTFIAHTRRLQEQCMTNLEHRTFLGFEVLRELNRTRRIGPRALMPIFFNSVLDLEHSGRPPAEPEPAPGADISHQEAYAGVYTPQMLLIPTVIEDGDGNLHCNWQAMEDAFPAGLAQTLLEAYQRHLRRLADDDSCWHATVRSLTPPAHASLQAGIAEPAAPATAERLDTLIARQAHRQPARTAIVAPRRTLTFAELLRQAAHVAAWLRSHDAQPNTLVGVVMEPGWEPIVAALGTLLAGAAYLPIDPQPGDQVQAALRRGAVALALTQPWLEPQYDWPDHVLRLCVEYRSGEADGLFSAETPRSAADLACVIPAHYTTAQRWALLDHQSLAGTVQGLAARFGIGPDDRVLALARLSCDRSLFDIFGLLAAGGALVIPPSATADSAAQWAELIAREHVTIWNAPPALLDRLLAYGAARPDLDLHTLRLVLLSQDRAAAPLLADLRAQAPSAQVACLIGATEAGVWSMQQTVDAADRSPPGSQTVRPLSNQRLYVLDEHLEPRPLWVIGRLYIGGAGLAQGYWRDQAATRAAFVRHPGTGERLYRTNHLARLLPGGPVELCAQAEEGVVELHGRLVSLERIEQALERHPALRRAVVILREDSPRLRHLVAYVVTTNDERRTTNDKETRRQGDKETRRQEDREADTQHATRNTQHLSEQSTIYNLQSTISESNGQRTRTIYRAPTDYGQLTKELRAFLKDQLPAHLIPEQWVFLATLPVTPDGRIDRRGLPAPPDLADDDAPPAETARQLAALWSAALGRDDIRLDDDFFDLGGDSFTAVVVAQQLGGRLSLQDMFAHPTLGAQARRLAQTDYTR